MQNDYEESKNMAPKFYKGGERGRIVSVENLINGVE